MNDIVGQAFERFTRTGKPLAPPLLLVIDEAATLRPHQLPSWAATLAGVGVQLVTAWLSVAQIEAAYGRDSQAILTNHLTKLFFAGMSDQAGLDYLSRLLGEEHVPSRLSSQSSYGARREDDVTTVPVVPPAALRRMRPGDALLVHGTLPPAHVRIKPWYGSRRMRKRASSRSGTVITHTAPASCLSIGELPHLTLNRTPVDAAMDTRSTRASRGRRSPSGGRAKRGVGRHRDRAAP